MEPSAWIAFAALMVTVFAVSGGGLWALFSKLDTTKVLLGKMVTETRSAVETQHKGLELKVEQAFATLSREVEALERRSAEPILALREKVTQIELYVRDTFVSKREYEKDHAQLLLALKDIQEAIEKRLDAYEERVEKAIENLGAQGRLPLA